MSFTDKAKTVDRGYKSCAHESTGCKLQYEPYLFSVVCSKTNDPFLEKFGRSGKVFYTEKLKSLIEVPYVALLKVQVPSFNLNLISSP